MEIFIRNDQPTTCQYCGALTFIIMDLFCTKYQTQLHECLKCTYFFIEENEYETQN